MSKLNKRGMTAVELLVCFVLVGAIVVSLFDVIANYKNKEQIEEINNEVISFSNNLQKTIQNDFIKGHLVSVNSVSADKHSASFSFDTPSNYETFISIKPSEGVISYGTSSNTIDYEIPSITDLVLSDESVISYVPALNSVLKITIVLKHPNFDEETYSFVITCPVNYIY